MAAAAESKPLLSEPNSNKGFFSIDEVIEHCIGDSSWNQLFQALLVSFASVFDAQQTFINVFTDTKPAWQCADPNDKLCRSAAEPCSLPDSTWVWAKPKQSSIVSDWDLQCFNSSISGVPASAYFAGSLAGGFLLCTLADSSLGRKNMLLLSCLIMSLAGALTAAAPNVWVYSMLRLATGFGRAMLGSCGLVLSMETVGKRWHGKVSAVAYFCFTLGFLSLPAMAYVNRGSSWRNIYLWASIPSLGYTILVYFFVCESPRWLLTRGRIQEAIHTLKLIASANVSDIDDSFSDVAVVAKDISNTGIYSTLRIFWDRKWAFRRLASLMVAGFGVGIAYYGMPLGVGALGFDLYLSVASNAIAELPAALVTFFLIGVFNRKPTLLVLTTGSGMLSLLCVFLRSVGLRIAAEVVSYFAACTAFNFFLIYCLELFPTCVRNSALCMVRQAIVLGCAVAPMLVAAVRNHGSLYYGMFGLGIGCCGLFVIGLPETKGRGIFDTVDEEEYSKNGGQP